MKPRNLATSLRCRATSRPMEAFDRLPPELRRWVATAALPWSTRSVLRLWARLHRETGGDTSRMIRRMDLAEQRMLMRDGRRIWGEGYVEVVLFADFPTQTGAEREDGGSAPFRNGPYRTGSASTSKLLSA